MSLGYSKRDQGVTEAEELHEQVLQWLNPELNEPPKNIYDSKLEEKEDGTCIWFWDHSDVKEWLTRRSGILWIHGAPGVGKSVLCSSIISKLVEDREVVAYFFCVANQRYEPEPNSTTQKLNSPESILRSLIVQLLEIDRKWRVPDRLKELYKRHKRFGAPAIGFRDLKLILQWILDIHPRSYIIIDGLDEVNELGQDNPNQLKKLLKILDLKPFGVVRWLLVSQWMAVVDNALGHPNNNANRAVAYRELDLAEVDLQFKDEIKSMVKAVLEEKFSTPPSDWESFLNHIVELTEGNFLCAKLLLDDLRDCPSLDQCVQSLNDHKAGLANHYLRGLRRMACVQTRSWPTVK